MEAETMVEGIVLAAGSSSRAGCFKMELPLGDKLLIERSLEGMYSVCSRIIVVGGHRIDRLREILIGYQKVEVVENVQWKSGMFSSVQLGVAHAKASRVFLLPADIPLVPETVYTRLLLAEGDVLIPSFRERIGHPVLLGSTSHHEILREPHDSNLRNVIRRIGHKAVPVEHEEILIDIDSPEDLKSVRDRFFHLEQFAQASV